MTRTTFNESDIPALDFIIDRILETDFKVFSNDLVDAGFLHGTGSDIEEKFESLLAVIDSYGCADTIPDLKGDIGSCADKNLRTAKFKSDGGFRKVFKEQQKSKSIKRKKQTAYFVGIGCTVIMVILGINKCITDKEESKRKSFDKSELANTTKEELPLFDSLSATKPKVLVDTLLIDSLMKK